MQRNFLFLSSFFKTSQWLICFLAQFSEKDLLNELSSNNWTLFAFVCVSYVYCEFQISTDFAAGRQALWLDGGIHAREWIAPATMVYYIDQVN